MLSFWPVRCGIVTYSMRLLSRLAPVTCFPALMVGYTVHRHSPPVYEFSRAFHIRACQQFLGVFPRISPVPNFRVLAIG